MAVSTPHVYIYIYIYIYYFHASQSLRENHEILQHAIISYYKLLYTDGTNKFVNVTFDNETNSIYCTFLNSQDNSDKSCNVSYSSCGDQLVQTAMGIANTERPNFVEISLELTALHAYCYVVAASNGTFKVLIEGRIMIREGDYQGKHVLLYIVPRGR